MIIGRSISGRKSRTKMLMSEIIELPERKTDNGGKAGKTLSRTNRKSVLRVWGKALRAICFCNTKFHKYHKLVLLCKMLKMFF